MEFWGVEIKAGVPQRIDPGEGNVIHLSQAVLGETKKDKGNDSVFIYVNVNDQKLVLGNLSTGSIPQIQYDVVFEQEFELSHNWKNGSVYFCGYKTENPVQEGPSDDEFDSESSDEEMDLPLENGKPETKVVEVKPSAVKVNASKPESSTKPKVKLVEPAKDDESDEDDDSSEDEDSDEDLGSGEDESDDEDMESSDEEETPTPKKPEAGKKRSNDAATPASTKKAKLVTPQKTDAKKAGGHTATPHPSKQATKTPANSEKSKTPKSAGSVSCGTCSKTFNSEQALSSHSKAKHSAAK